MNNNLNTSIPLREIDKTTKQAEVIFAIYFHVYENVRPCNFDKDAVPTLDRELINSTKMLDEEITVGY